MRPLLKGLFTPSRHDVRDVAAINTLRQEYEALPDRALDQIATSTTELHPFIAVTAVLAQRILGERMFDVQLRGTLALIRGSIAEMQTGEGKTLTAVPADRLAGAHQRQRACDDRERLSGTPRRGMDGADLPAFGFASGVHPAGDDAF